MTVFVNAIMYYRVKDPISAVANVDDYSGSARLLAATTLRNVLGTRNLGDILADRESIAQEMQVGLIYFQTSKNAFFFQQVFSGRSNRCVGCADRASGGERCPSAGESSTRHGSGSRGC